MKRDIVVSSIVNGINYVHCSLQNDVWNPVSHTNSHNHAWFSAKQTTQLIVGYKQQDNYWGFENCEGLVQKFYDMHT
jgi:hypothetical protein